MSDLAKSNEGSAGSVNKAPLTGKPKGGLAAVSNFGGISQNDLKHDVAK